MFNSPGYGKEEENCVAENVSIFSYYSTSIVKVDTNLSCLQDCVRYIIQKEYYTAMFEVSKK